MVTTILLLVLWMSAYVSAEVSSLSQPDNGLISQSLTPPLYPPYKAPVEDHMAAADQSQGFSVQTGYEGYLLGLPSTSSIIPTEAVGLLSSLFYPKLALGLLSKAVLWFGGFLLIAIIGAGLTTGICALTPLCTISFLGLGVSKEYMRSYLTPDKLTTISNFVNNAIEKYKQMQTKESNKIK